MFDESPTKAVSADRKEHYRDETAEDAYLAGGSDALPKEHSGKDGDGKNRTAHHHRKNDIGGRIAQRAQQGRIACVGCEPDAYAEKGLGAAEAPAKPEQQQYGEQRPRCVQRQERGLLVSAESDDMQVLLQELS